MKRIPKGERPIGAIKKSIERSVASRLKDRTGILLGRKTDESSLWHVSGGEWVGENAPLRVACGGTRNSEDAVATDITGFRDACEGLSARERIELAFTKQ